MDDLREKLTAIMKDLPAGDLHKVQNDTYADELGRLFRVQSHQQIEAKRELSERLKQLGKDRRHFVFTDMEAVREIIDHFSNKHLGYLFTLLCYMEFKTGRLVNAKGESLTIQEIREALGVRDNRTVNKFIRSMTDRGVIEERADGYYINRKYHFRDEAFNERVIKTFMSALKKASEMVSKADLGILYRLLPYVHYSTNMICINPFEQDAEKIEYLNAGAVAELVGIHERKARAALDRLRKAGIIAETTLRDRKREVFYTLNPYIFYRKPGKPDESLRAMFAATPYAGAKGRIVRRRKK